VGLIAAAQEPPSGEPTSNDMGELNPESLTTQDTLIPGEVGRDGEQIAMGVAPAPPVPGRAAKEERDRIEKFNKDAEAGRQKLDNLWDEHYQQRDRGLSTADNPYGLNAEQLKKAEAYAFDWVGHGGVRDEDMTSEMRKHALNVLEENLARQQKLRGVPVMSARDLAKEAQIAEGRKKFANDVAGAVGGPIVGGYMELARRAGLSEAQVEQVGTFVSGLEGAAGSWLGGQKPPSDVSGQRIESSPKRIEIQPSSKPEPPLAASSKGGGSAFGKGPAFSAKVTEAEAYDLRQKTIASTRNASPEGKKIANDALEYVLGDPDAALRKYYEIPETKGGKVINTDYGREIIPAVAASKEARLAYSDVVQRPIGWLMDRLYKQSLTEAPKPGERPRVFITAGGPGSGKTSAIESIGALKRIMDESQIIRDTTLTWRESSIRMIDQALAANKKVTVAYVDRDPVKSLTDGILPRAEENGRAVGLNFAAESHSSAPITIRELIKHYEGNPNVDFKIVSNHGGKGEAKLVDTSSIRPLSEADLKARLNSALEDMYKQGKISKAVYEKTKSQ